MPAVTFTTRGALRKSALRQANERLVLNTIRQNPSISRSDIARMTGLSASSVTFIVDRLMRNRWICEEKNGNHSQVGRRPTALKLRPEVMMAIGVEIARSGTRIVLADLTGAILQRKTVPWHLNNEILLDRVRTAIRSMLDRVGVKRVLGVGVSSPGTIHRPAGKVTAENLGWNGVEVEQLLRNSLTVPFYLENNAKLSALAERWFVEPGQKLLQDFVFVTLKEGLGTGVILNGHIMQGATGAAAEFGHTIVYPDGRRCMCGNRGCWEQYASADALRRLYAEQCGSRTVKAAPDAEDVISLARGGDKTAGRVLRETATQLGLGFCNLIMALNPEAIIVGDYAAVAWDLIEDCVWEVLKSRIPHYYLAGVRIFPSAHAAESSLLGALALVFSHFLTRFEHDYSVGPPNLVSMHASG
jgi:predicted NBD/HSP70 family sugar kinase